MVIKRIALEPTQRRWRLNKKTLKAVLAGSLVVGVLGYLLLVRPVMALAADVQRMIQAGHEISRAAKDQDLAEVKNRLPEVEQELRKTQADLGKLAWVRFIPMLKNYWQDAHHFLQAGLYGVEAGKVATETLTPYADLLGLKGESTFAEGTAEERIQTVVSTLAKMNPALDLFGAKVELIWQELNQIAPERYPKEFKGRPVREYLGKARSALNSLAEFFVETRPFIGVLPGILGDEEPQRYLLLFQNDGELRATGGFLTAYALFTVDKGKITAERSEDIYVLDHSLTKIFPLPDPLKQSPLQVSSWHLRDSNLSPDFAESMKQFEEMYQYARRYEEIDGIVALDTEFLANIIKVLGPINAYGMEFTAENQPDCNCPQVIYELEKIVDTPVAFERSGRKDILGVLMIAIMQKGLQSSPSQIWPQMLQTILTDLKEKHLLLYFHQPDWQEAVEKVGFAGKILPFEGDYLHVNDTNFGGAKANLFVEHKVIHDYKHDQNGQIAKTLTVEYFNPYPWSNCNLEAGELCLNGEATIWSRVYVPQGSQVVKDGSLDEKIEAGEELGKTYFPVWLTVRPEGTASYAVSYTLPLRSEGTLALFIQKQPGKAEEVHEIRVDGQLKKTLTVRHDEEIEVEM